MALRKHRFPAALMLYACCFTYSLAHGAEIWIMDCQGKPQLAQRIDPQQRRELRLNVSKPIEGKLVLRAAKGDSIIEGNVTKGLAAFSGVPEGSWKLCTANNESVEGLSLASDSDGGVSLVEAALGGAAAGVAVAGFTASGSSANRNADTPNAFRENAGTMGSLSGPEPQTKPAKVSSPRGECFVGEKVVPLSPFM